MTPEQFEKEFFGKKIKYPQWPKDRYIVPNRIDTATSSRFWGIDNLGKLDWFPINPDWQLAEGNENREPESSSISTDPKDLYDWFLCWDQDIERRKKEILERMKGGKEKIHT